MKRKCYNLHGYNQYQIGRMLLESDNTLEGKIMWIETNASSARFEYCSMICPIKMSCKFINKYGEDWRKKYEDRLEEEQ